MPGASRYEKSQSVRNTLFDVAVDGIDPSTITSNAVIGNRPRQRAYQKAERVCGPKSGGSLGAAPGLKIETAYDIAAIPAVIGGIAIALVRARPQSAVAYA